MKYNIILVFISFVLFLKGIESSGQNRTDQFLVIDGKPNAEIIIDKNPKRAAKFAAAEL